MVERIREVREAAVPTFIYGTAWKEDRTHDLVRLALEAGFRAFDTANQRRHYNEELMGAALAAAVVDGSVHRDDLFLQTKFTHRAGQDHRLPYEPTAPITQQVTQSFESSLEHLGVEVIDSYLLHGPSLRLGLGRADVEAWRAMESLHDLGKVRLIGISNVSADQLVALLQIARVRPAFVQNRCYASLGWDAEVRALCGRERIVYQAFSLLTANAGLLRGSFVEGIASRHRRTVAQVVFRFALQVGMIPLTGTTDPRHMAEDLAVYDFELGSEEVSMVEGIAGTVWPTA